MRKGTFTLYSLSHSPNILINFGLAGLQFTAVNLLICKEMQTNWAPGVLGILGEWLFIFRELGSTCNYFRGSREQAHNLGDLGSPAKKQKNKGKASILFNFF